MTSSIIIAMDRGEVTSLILDLSAAFDTIDHVYSAINNIYHGQDEG